MTQDTPENSGIDYLGFIDEAMRGVVKRALTQVAKHGLPGNHHFYVSFATDYPGVQLSSALKERYPREITIVIQHQYWDLDVRDAHFSVMLSFNNIPEKLVIPYRALTAFADPSIKFGLQFHHHAAESVEDAAATLEDALAGEFLLDASFEAPTSDEGGEAPANSSAEVISLDSFRKK